VSRLKFLSLRRFAAYLDRLKCLEGVMQLESSCSP